jgi:hypothetical protein
MREMTLRLVNLTVLLPTPPYRAKPPTDELKLLIG